MGRHDPRLYPPAINNTPTKSANLLGWWTFDNDSGTTVADSSGNGYDGVASSANIYKTDVPFGTGKSIDLNGNQYVTVSDGGNQLTFNGGNAFSISTWVKEWPDGGWEPYISKKGEGQGWQLRRRGGDQDRYASLPAGSETTTGTSKRTSTTTSGTTWSVPSVPGCGGDTRRRSDVRGRNTIRFH